MKNIAMKLKNIHFISLLICVLLLASCGNNGKSASNNDTKIDVEDSPDRLEFLIGSWKDTSKSALHFTLFKDGTARSDNMKTLLYKNWSSRENKITFIIESIGNGISTTDSVTYNIEKLTSNELILKKGDYLYTYQKE